MEEIRTKMISAKLKKIPLQLSLKCALVAINSLLLVLALTEIGVLAGKGYLPNFDNVFIALLGLSLLVSTCGCVGSLFENKTVLAVHAVLTFILFILHIVGIVACKYYIDSVKQSFLMNMETALSNSIISRAHSPNGYDGGNLNENLSQRPQHGPLPQVPSLTLAFYDTFEVIYGFFIALSLLTFILDIVVISIERTQPQTQPTDSE